MVSIIMPAYNMGAYISDSINSVIAQTYKDWELIVVNDGSIDNTVDVVEKFGEFDPRIRLINQENKGVSSARNRGIDEANGEYITFLDGDDLFLSNFLSKMVDAHSGKKVPFVYCGNITRYSNGKEKHHEQRYKYEEGNILQNLLLGVVSMCMNSILVEKEFIKTNNIKFIEECSTGEDIEFISKILSLSLADVVPEELTVYQIRSGSATNCNWNWNSIDKFYSLLRIKKYITEHYIHDNMNEVLQILDEKTAFWVFRFLWGAIKNGFHDQALTFIKCGQYQEYLEKIKLKPMNLPNRLKRKVIFSLNPFLWMIATKVK